MYWSLKRSIDFKAYMQSVDAAINAACGMNSGDLPDYKYYDAFDTGMEPTQCALAALEYSRSM